MLRRAFIKNMTLLTLGWNAHQAWGYTSQEMSDSRHYTIQQILSQFSDIPGMREIGARLYSASGQYGDVGRVISWLTEFEVLARQGGWKGTLNHQIRKDYADGATVVVDGWVLSHTEACLCVLSTTI